MSGYRPPGRRSRRVTRPGAPGADDRPSDHPLTERATEDQPDTGDSVAPGIAGPGAENDDRLTREKPPHWG